MNNVQEKLCLGTVQFGLKYGIKNELGRQPNKKEVFRVLQKALEAKIDTFDTASAYGNAEEVLGQFNLVKKGIHIITKLRPCCPNDEQYVLDEIRESLYRLNASSLTGYMLHEASDMRKSNVWNGLLKAKKLGLIEKIGVSIYNPEEAFEALALPQIDCIQIPYNVLDQRLDRTDFFVQATLENIEIYARSVFLQGLLLMTPDCAEASVHGSGIYIKRIHEIAQSYGFTVKEATMLFGLSHPNIRYVVFGVDTINQLEENIAIAQKNSNFALCREALVAAFDTVPREIIIPSLWG